VTQAAMKDTATLNKIT